MSTKGLSERQQSFIREYTADYNGARAAVAAGYAESCAAVMACRLIKNPYIASEIERIKNERVELVEAETTFRHAEVISHIAQIVQADPRELMETVLDCCRYCHGEGFGYMRTPAEFRRDYEAWQNRVYPKPTDVFDMKGGVGFDPRKDPRDDCPECHGAGESRVIIKDTRKLSPAAARLYAGVKMTKNGIEIMTRSQDKMIELAGRHFGIFKDQVKLEHSGPDGQPIQTASVVVNVTDPIDAARSYQDAMRRGK